MRLGTLLQGLPGILGVAGDPSVEITRVVSDSRQAGPGALFVAYRGVGTDGHRFITDALARGAAAIAGENPPSSGLTVPCVTVADGRAALAWLSAAWEGHPSRAFLLAGVTGTDGKTTTCNLLYQILLAAGRRPGLISTVNAVIGDRTYDTGLHTTTPDASEVQHYLAQMRDAGVDVAVLETTSHGLAQHRVTGCAFDVAVVTNITHEHLDFHGSFESYREAKAMLFRMLSEGVRKKGAGPKTAVLNGDDASFDFLAAIPVERRLVYSLRPPSDDLRAAAGWRLHADAVTHTPGGMMLDLRIDAPPDLRDVPLTLRSPLVGDFNASNILAAAGAALALGIPLPAIATGVAALAGVPGRMERIDRGQAFTAIVDFAHTPNALARALEAVRPFVAPPGRLVVAFGCAGLRDRAKRRLMGEVAALLADYTVITAEDPRTESLDDIIAETAEALVAQGRREGVDFERVPDRQTAIMRSVDMARAGDVVIVCGKGHERSMCFGATEHPWSDQDALAWALQRRSGSGPEVPPNRLPTWPG